MEEKEGVLLGGVMLFGVMLFGVVLLVVALLDWAVLDEAELDGVVRVTATGAGLDWGAEFPTRGKEAGAISCGLGLLVGMTGKGTFPEPATTAAALADVRALALAAANVTGMRACAVILGDDCFDEDCTAAVAVAVVVAAAVAVAAVVAVGIAVGVDAVVANVVSDAVAVVVVDALEVTAREGGGAVVAEG